MATTNIDAVAEFKVLTNAYQAEYGRAVGGQLQVVTKSGSRDFHGSGYWYGRRSDWNANTWTNKRNDAETPKAKTTRNDCGYTVGGPVFAPGLQRGQEEAVLLLQPGVPAPRRDPATERQTRVPTALERRGDFSQSVDSSGNPFPYIRDYQTGLPVHAPPTRAAASRTAASLGRIPANRLYAPGLAALEHLPGPELQRAAAASTSPARRPNSTPRREELLRMDFQATRQLARHRPLHEDEGRTSSRPTARPGPATAATSSRRRRSSCTPARTTCCRRPAS